MMTTLKAANRIEQRLGKKGNNDTSSSEDEKDTNIQIKKERKETSSSEDELTQIFLNGCNSKATMIGSESLLTCKQHGKRTND